MASKRTIMIAAGAVVLAVAGVAVAAELDERGENKIVGEHSEKKIALDQVPAAAMAAARAQLTSVTKAEQVTTKDGRTLYEVKGKNSAGKTVELFVSEKGEVLGTED
jgi:hypothetical protein